jgi:formyl-CoA transferase
MKSPDGLRALHELAERADVLIHNLRPDVPRAIGIDPQTFCARHPRLIYCEISGFGFTGPLSMEPAFEPLIQAFSGIVSVNGDPSSPPCRLPISAVDLGTGMWTVIGLLAALRRRDKTGRGGVVRTSLFETALGWMSQRVNSLVNEGIEMRREPMSGHAGLVPYQSFSARDGDLFVCVGNDRLFGKFCTVIGRPQWVTDPAFATNRARLRNRDTIVPLIAEMFAGATRDGWIERLREAGVPCAPVNSVRDVLELEQFHALGMLSPELDDGPTRLVSIPLTLDGERMHPRGVGPRLGADNASLADVTLAR